MDIFLISQIGIATLGPMSFLLIIRDSYKSQAIGVILGLACVPFWWLMVASTEQWLTIHAHLLYTYGLIDKAIRLRKGRHIPVQTR